ncbi:flippase-like domain-containing protein [candidate division WOR-3 bacterium]|jgi:uncharacterized protein (TIRG00374 family)|nr:flippase-like domain-containing protein [candidate division WOR-3 bacterium]
MENRIKNILFNALRLFVAVLLMFLILRSIDFVPILGRIKTINLLWLLLGFLLTLFLVYLNAIRWKILLSTHNVNLSVWKLFRVYLIGFFFNNFLPSSIGLDTVRTVYLRQHGLKEVASSVIIERFIGVISLFIYMFIGFMFIERTNIDFNIILYSMIVLFVLILMFFLLFNKRIVSVFKPLVLKIRYKNIGSMAIEFYKTFLEYANNKKDLLLALLTSFLIQTIVIFINITIAKMYYIDIGIIHFFSLIPIISVLSMIPVSINAIGIREGAYVYFFTMVGTTKEMALLISLSFLVITAMTSLIGGVLFVFEKGNKKLEKSNNKCR